MFGTHFCTKEINENLNVQLFDVVHLKRGENVRLLPGAGSSKRDWH